MFVTVFTFRAKPGQEARILALHEEWRQERLAKAQGFVSGELLRSVNDPLAFTDIARFRSEEDSRAVASDPEQDRWYGKLVSLTEAEPLFVDYQIAWQLEDGRTSKL